MFLLLRCLFSYIYVVVCYYSLSRPVNVSCMMSPVSTICHKKSYFLISKFWLFAGLHLKLKKKLHNNNNNFNNNNNCKTNSFEDAHDLLHGFFEQQARFGNNVGVSYVQRYVALFCWAAHLNIELFENQCWAVLNNKKKSCNYNYKSMKMKTRAFVI